MSTPTHPALPHFRVAEDGTVFQYVKPLGLGVTVPPPSTAHWTPPALLDGDAAPARHSSTAGLASFGGAR